MSVSRKQRMAASKESFTTAAGPIHIDVYSPPSTGKRAGVLVLQGTLGLDPPFGAAIDRSIFGTPATAPPATASDQFIEYPGEKHRFTRAALVSSRDTTIQFLDQHLK